MVGPPPKTPGRLAAQGLPFSTTLGGRGANPPRRIVAGGHPSGS